VPSLLRGRHGTLAIRVDAHPTPNTLIRRLRQPLVSTSANRHGRAPVTSRRQLRQRFGPALAAIAPGHPDSRIGPSAIRDLRRGHLLRAPSSAMRP